MSMLAFGYVWGYSSRMSKIGRPTKYDESMPDKVYAYIEKCKSKPQGETRDGLTIEQLPLLCGLVKVLKVNQDTITEWRKRYEPFSAACNELLSEQKKILVQLGLSGAFNSTIAARMLSANHGLNEKQKLEVEGSALPPFIINLSEPAKDE